MQSDIFGKAISDFYFKRSTEDIIVRSPDFEDDSIPVPYLFRSYDKMPAIEQKALNLSLGPILDVGCGAGSHALYLQNKRKMQVTAIDLSKGAIAICKERGIRDAQIKNFFAVQNQKYRTLLFLMNGSGIIGKLDNIDQFFRHCKTLLDKNGQILLDSSDLSYLYAEEDGGFWIDANQKYYGELSYQLQYKKKESSWFDWLYIDYNTLQNASNANGFLCELVLEGNHYDYLARLTLAN